MGAAMFWSRKQAVRRKRRRTLFSCCVASTGSAGDGSAAPETSGVMFRSSASPSGGSFDLIIAACQSNIRMTSQLHNTAARSPGGQRRVRREQASCITSVMSEGLCGCAAHAQAKGQQLRQGVLAALTLPCC